MYLLLPIPDACRALGISRSTLYALIGAGDITPRKIGRKTLIAREDLERFAATLVPSPASPLPSRPAPRASRKRG